MPTQSGDNPLSDFNGDGFEDLLLALPNGGARLLLGGTDGMYEDATELVGLDLLTTSRSIKPADFDGDGHLDFAGVSAGGALVLLRNDGTGRWESVASQLGLELLSGVQRVQWGKYDSKVLPDLLVEDEAGVMLYGNRQAGGFIPLLHAPIIVTPPTRTEHGSPDCVAFNPFHTPGPNTRVDGPSFTALTKAVTRQPGATAAVLTRGGNATTPSLGFGITPSRICAVTVKDASSGACIKTDTTPTLGRLLPLSTDLNVSAAGNVGIGTTAPNAKLTVNGSFTRMIARASGIGPNEPIDVGRLMSRTLNITKLDASTSLRVSYSDVFRVLGPAQAQGRWEIRVDGFPVAASPAHWDFYTSTSFLDMHRPSTMIAYLDGISAGVHTIEIWVGNVPGYASVDRFTGWNDSRWTIECEEVF